MVPAGAAPQVKTGSTALKSSVQLWLKEFAGSRVLGSRSRTRVWVLSPVNALLGICPPIWTRVALLKSAAKVNEKNTMLVVVSRLTELRETCNLKLDSGSESAEIAANAPSFVNLKC